MLQFFGILASLDCTDDLWSVGAIGVMVGALMGVVAWHWIMLKYR